MTTCYLYIQMFEIKCLIDRYVYFKGDTYLSFKLNDNVLSESVTHAFNISTQDAEPQELGV